MILSLLKFFFLWVMPFSSKKIGAWVIESDSRTARANGTGAVIESDTITARATAIVVRFDLRTMTL
jgi:formylmethanofuran dehydrogenase subunit E-like metal-binding protein